MPNRCKTCAKAIREGALLRCENNPILRRGLTPGCENHVPVFGKAS